METKIKKVTINMPEDVLDLLRTWATERNSTVTEVLKQAVRTENFIQNEIKADHKILVEDEKGAVKQIVFQR